MLFLLTDFPGRGLIVAKAETRADAERFGLAYLPEFSGESLEIDVAGQGKAEQIWGVRTVQVLHLPSKPSRKSRQKKPASSNLTATMTHIWVRGPELPEEVVEDDLLTQEDHRDVTLDHIARTSDIIGHVEIRKWAASAP